MRPPFVFCLAVRRASFEIGARLSWASQGSGRAGEGRVKRGGGGLDSRNRAKASPTPSAGRFFPHGRAGAILTILWPWNNGEKRGG